MASSGTGGWAVASSVAVVCHSCISLSALCLLGFVSERGDGCDSAEADIVLSSVLE